MSRDSGFIRVELHSVISNRKDLPGRPRVPMNFRPQSRETRCPFSVNRRGRTSQYSTALSLSLSRRHPRIGREN